MGSWSTLPGEIKHQILLHLMPVINDGAFARHIAAHKHDDSGSFPRYESLGYEKRRSQHYNLMPLLLVSKQFSLDMRQPLQFTLRGLVAYQKSIAQAYHARRTTYNQTCTYTYSSANTRLENELAIYSRWRSELTKCIEQIEKLLDSTNRWSMYNPCWKQLPPELVRKIVLTALSSCESFGECHDPELRRIAQNPDLDLRIEQHPVGVRTEYYESLIHVAENLTWVAKQYLRPTLEILVWHKALLERLNKHIHAEIWYAENAWSNQWEELMEADLESSDKCEALREKHDMFVEGVKRWEEDVEWSIRRLRGLRDAILEVHFSFQTRSRLDDFLGPE